LKKQHGRKNSCVCWLEKKISVNILRLIAPPLRAPPPRHKDLSEQNSEQTDKKIAFSLCDAFCNVSWFVVRQEVYNTNEAAEKVSKLFLFEHTTLRSHKNAQEF
jgi:hypothetical protein